MTLYQIIVDGTLEYEGFNRDYASKLFNSAWENGFEAEWREVEVCDFDDGRKDYLENYAAEAEGWCEYDV